MAFTQTDVDSIDRAIASGELTVRFANGKEVTYRSIRDLKEARSLMLAEIGGSSADSTTPRIRQVRMYSDKGF